MEAPYWYPTGASGPGVLPQPGRQDMFPAIVLEPTGQGVAAGLRQLEEAQLPAGEVTVGVTYSALNYKDGMAIKGLGNLVKEYPHVPGVDLVGTVESSQDPRWREGDGVIAMGCWPQPQLTLSAVQLSPCTSIPMYVCMAILLGWGSTPGSRTCQPKHPPFGGSRQYAG